MDIFLGKLKVSKKHLNDFKDYFILQSYTTLPKTYKKSLHRIKHTTSKFFDKPIQCNYCITGIY